MTEPAAIPRKPILSAQEVTRSFGGQPVLRGVSLTVHEGDRIGLTGRNGSGKSTLLRIMAGLDTPDQGHVTRAQGLRVGLLGQQCQLDPSLTVGQVLERASAEIRALIAEYHQVTAQLAAELTTSQDRRRVEARCAALQHHLDVANAWDPTLETKRMRIALNLPPAGRVVGSLSGGELRRVDLAATLLGRPDVLLLDEPTNQLDTRNVQWIEDFLEAYRGSCMLVTHDRYFLYRIVTRIAEIDENRLYAFPGNYTRFLEYKAGIHEHQARTEANRQAALRRELAWLRRGPKARTTKQKARIQRYHELEEQGATSAHAEFSFAIPQPRRLGKRILEAQEIGHGYGKRMLFHGLSVIMQKHMRVGIIGPNGCGKTTLLRILMGRERPNEGEVVLGDATEFLYVDQTREEVHPDTTILEHVSNGLVHWPTGDARLYVPGYLEQFLFDRDSVHMPMRNLSGGELGRIELAKKLLRGGNVLVLDEPTNDLDLPTLRVLEEAVVGFPGCALVVSHDRYFLNRVCTHMIAFVGRGRVEFLAGNYDDYLLYTQRHAPAPRAKKPPKPRPAKPKAVARGLTWKEKKELAGIEGAIQETEAELGALEGQVATPEFYRREPAHIKDTLAALEDTKKRAETLYDRWQELEQRLEADA